MVEADAGISRAHGCDRATPELRTGQHVGFVDRADSSRAAFRTRESESRDALYLRGRVRFGVKGTLYAFFDHAAALAEIYASGKLAHDFEVQITQPVSAQWRDSAQRLQQFYGTNINVESEPLPQRQQAALRAFANRKRIPLGPADRAKENGVGLMARVQSGVGKRRSSRIDRGAANRKFRKIKLMMELMRSFAEHGNGGPSHLRADAVSGKQNNGLLHGQTPMDQS